jgi:hypothetical protein
MTTGMRAGETWGDVVDNVCSGIGDCVERHVGCTFCMLNQVASSKGDVGDCDPFDSGSAITSEIAKFEKRSLVERVHECWQVKRLVLILKMVDEYVQHP